jgi:hypothetical protein
VTDAGALMTLKLLGNFFHVSIVAMEAGLRPASTRVLLGSDLVGGRFLDNPNRIPEWEQRLGEADSRCNQ